MAAKRASAGTSATFTYQTRLVLAPEQDAALDAYAELHGRAERALFAAMQAGHWPADLKATYLLEYGLTARQFNAIRIGLEGKIASIMERRPQLIAEAQERIARTEKVVAKLEKVAPGTRKLHQKKRRLATGRARLAALQADEAAGKVRLCFGGRKLFRAQFDLEANGYASLDTWRADWHAARAAQFFVVGSKDETAGCQGCVALRQDDGALALRLRLPNALADGPQGKYLTLTAVRFAYGQASIEAALAAGTALSYRFLHDTKGWRVFVTATLATPERATRRQAGALGVDINADHLALAETDRFGNLVRALRIDCHTYGKSQDQARAAIGDAVKAAVAVAREAGKPLAIEKLDFAKKKAALVERPRRSRALSAFAYSATGAGLSAAALRAGVEVLAVNPAYTSTIGAVNHAQPHGISIHQGAALAIARRALSWRERPTVRHGVVPVPVRNGGHVTLDLPARNRSGHVWSFWSCVRRRLAAAHVAHFRSGGLKGPPSPLPRAIPALGPTRILPARLRHANRPQHCSADVLEDIPW